MVLKSIFEQVSPLISLYHFPLVKEFDLKKLSSPFKDLDKFLKPIPAISFPLTVRHGNLAFEHVTRPQRTTDRKKRKNKPFLQLMGKHTISDTTKVYPRPTFTQNLCSWHLPDIGNHVLYWLHRWQHVIRGWR